MVSLRSRMHHSSAGHCAHRSLGAVDRDSWQRGDAQKPLEEKWEAGGSRKHEVLTPVGCSTSARRSPNVALLGGTRVEMAIGIYPLMCSKWLSRCWAWESGPGADGVLFANRDANFWWREFGVHVGVALMSAD